MQVLGGDVGYGQCLGVIGYCLLPLVLTGLAAPLLATLLPIAAHPVKVHFPGSASLCKGKGRGRVQLLGLGWAVYSAGSLLCVEELGSKRPLLLYPVFLLYLYFLSVYTGV